MGIEHDFGVYLLPGLGTGYPELKALELKLLTERVGKIPWLPQGWLSSVQSLDKENPGAVVKIATSKAMKLDATSFLNTDEKIKFWDELAAASNSIQMKYAANQAAAGKAELDGLYARATFWNAAYNIAVAIRDAPKNVIATAGEWTGDLLWTTVKKFAIPLVIVGVGIVIWQNRASFSKAIGKKVTG